MGHEELFCTVLLCILATRIKGRSCMDLTEAEVMKKRWQEYIEELYKNDVNDPDNDDGMITCLKPDIME